MKFKSWFTLSLRSYKYSLVLAFFEFKVRHCGLTLEQWKVFYMYRPFFAESAFDIDNIWKLRQPYPKDHIPAVVTDGQYKQTSWLWTTNIPNLLLANHYPIYRYAFQSFQQTLWGFWSSALSILIFQSLKIRGATFMTLVSLFGVTYIDAMISDDEPLTEPVEWSLLQTWIMIIFGLAWVAENFISSRYGSYTGRDKRVWFSWYKTFWLVEGWYVLSFGAAALFVITPFYNELSYNLTMIVGWWNWYTQVFFFTFISLYTFILYLSYYTQLTLRYNEWKKVLFYVAIVNLVLGYLLYGQFLISFFSYNTDPNWYHKSRFIDYIQLSHEPNKWSWGNSKRDHFSYHRSTTVFWFKTDLPMAAAMMLFNMFFFVCLFFLYIYWALLFLRVYARREVTYTYLTYSVSGLRQFFYFFLLFYVFVYFSFMVSYLRLPIELLWTLNFDSWFTIVGAVVTNYGDFLLSLL